MRTQFKPTDSVFVCVLPRSRTSLRSVLGAQKGRFVVTSGAEARAVGAELTDIDGNPVERPAPDGDPFERLERGEYHQNEALPILASLQAEVERKWTDPYAVNRSLRNRFRTRKKEERARGVEDARLRKRYALSIDLVQEAPEDVAHAKSLELGRPSVQTGLSALKRRKMVEASRRQLEESSWSAKKAQKAVRSHPSHPQSPQPLVEYESDGS